MKENWLIPYIYIIFLIINHICYISVSFSCSCYHITHENYLCICVIREIRLKVWSFYKPLYYVNIPIEVGKHLKWLSLNDAIMLMFLNKHLANAIQCICIILLFFFHLFFKLVIDALLKTLFANIFRMTKHNGVVFKCCIL